MLRRDFLMGSGLSLSALHRRAVQQATMALASTVKPSTSASRISVPGLHWPYFLVWLFFYDFALVARANTLAH